MNDPVLVVEDEHILRRNLVSCLERSGVAALGVDSIAAARRQLSSARFRLVCADIQLGDGDGIELIAELRKTEPDLPVVVMTGQDCTANRSRAETIDASAFLAKPFALSRFRELVRMLLNVDGSGASTTVGASPSVLMYSHDTIGLGHMRRNSAIAAEVVAAMPNASVLMLVGCPAGMIFDLPPGVDFVKLPSLTKVARDVWQPGSLRISSDATRALRAGLIERAVEAFRPDVFLVDHEPVGVWDELVPTLRALRADAARPHTVLGIRDILDDAESVRTRWQKRGIDERIAEFYDEVLVYGQEEVFPATSAYGLADLVARRAGYCGYVTPRRAIQPIRPRQPGQPPRIIASGGGGRDAYPVLKRVLAALACLPVATRKNAMLIGGPLMDRELFDRLAVEASIADVPCFASVNDLPSILEGADMFVTMGGYNALTEALNVGCPTLVVPRVGPSSEQRLRASLFAERGYVEMLEQEEATVDALVVRLARVRAGTRRRRIDLDFGGAAKAASRIVAQLKARHPLEPAANRDHIAHA